MTEPRPVARFATELASLLLTARRVLDPSDYVALLGHVAAILAELYGATLSPEQAA